MTFNRPQDITLVEMAQWVDAADVTQADEEKLTQYLYHLSLYNAQQRQLFRSLTDYDDFALFCVSKLWARLHNSAAAPVKSIVNYIKTVLSPWHAEYVRNFCTGSSDLQFCDFNVSDFADYLVDQTAVYEQSVYTTGCLDVCAALRNHIRKLPRRKNSAEQNNIYISCLLTLQDRINTAVNMCSSSMLLRDPTLSNRLIRELRTQPPILFHIDSCWSNYVSVVVQELIHVICAELTYTSRIRVNPSSCLKNLVIAASNEEDET